VHGGREISVIREYIVTSTDGSEIPVTILYSDDGFSGTLHKSAVLEYEVTKTRKDPIYKTVTQEFAKTIVKTALAKDNSIFPLQYPINESGYLGNIPRQKIDWEEVIETLTRDENVEVVIGNLAVKDENVFASHYDYNENGYIGRLPRTNVSFEEMYTTLLLPKIVNKKYTVTEKKVPEKIMEEDGLYKGELSLKDVSYIVTRTENRPVYRTVQKTFEAMTMKNNVPTKDDSVFDDQFEINNDGFIGFIPRTKVLWERDYSTINQHKVVYDYRYGMTSKNDNAFVSSKTYNQDGFTGTLQRQSVEYEVYQVAIYRTESKKFTKYSYVYNVSSKNNGLFSSSKTVNENGYLGSIPRTSVSWKEVWSGTRKSPTITHKVEKTSTSSNPNYSGTTVTVSYYDPASGKTITGTIPYKSKTLKKTNQTESTVRETTDGTFHWMSNSSVTYLWGKWSDSKPRKPSSYYGTAPGTGWTCYDAVWISALKGPLDPPWISSSGIPNKYAKKVRAYYERYVTTYTTTYVFEVEYEGKLDLPSVVTGYDGTATYSGSLSKLVFDHYENRYNGTATYAGIISKTVEDGWKGTAVYSGTLLKEVLDRYEDVPVEWEANAVYEGNLKYDRFDGYKGTAVYTGQVSKDVVKEFRGTATYKGELSKQVVDHYVDTPIEWRAFVLYEGYVNKPPDASFNMKEYAVTGEPVVIDNTSSDADGTIRDVRWSISPTTGHAGDLTLTGGTVVFMQPGDYTVTLEVTDNDNAKSVALKTIRVYANRNNPPVASFKLLPNPAYSDEVIHYDNTSYDPDGRGLETVVWTIVRPDGRAYTYTDTTPPRIFDLVGWEEGQYKVKLKVKDKGFSETIDGRTVTYPGMWSDEVEKTLVVKTSLQLKGVFIEKIVNPPEGTTLPVQLPVDSPVSIKAGYEITLAMETKGADEAEIRFYTNGTRLDVYNEDKEKVPYLVINEPEELQKIRFYLDSSVPKGTVVDMKIILRRNLPDGTRKILTDTYFGWQFARVVGSAKEDGNVNLTN
jgi:hypothetical protein